VLLPVVAALPVVARAHVAASAELPGCIVVFKPFSPGTRARTVFPWRIVAINLSRKAKKAAPRVGSEEFLPT